MGYKQVTPIKILVRRRGALGDVIMTTGVVRELKKLHPLSTITVQTEYKDVYLNNPHCDAVIAWAPEINAANFDLVYNLDNAYESNPANHFTDSYFHRVFGNDGLSMVRHSSLYSTEKEVKEATKFVEDLGAPFIAVHMRQWHWDLKNIKMDVWFDIFSKVFAVRTDFRIVTVGGPTDFAIEGHPLIVNANGKFKPTTLRPVLDHAKCFVGIDSGPFHVAASSNAPIVALLSHVRPEYIMPHRNIGDRVIQASVPCVGCHARQPLPVSSIKCEAGDFLCNRTWDTQAIADAILTYLP